MTNNIILKPKFNLLNSNFDGYKLKSDSYSSLLTRKIENGIYVNNSQNATCYIYTRMESLHNHLFSDPFEPYTVYTFNKKGHLLMFIFADGYIGAHTVVWQENLQENEENSTSEAFRFSPSISFPSSNFAITSNGSGILNILQTGDRNIGSSWVNVKEESKIPAGILISSLIVNNSSDKKFVEELHCLLLSVTTSEGLQNNSKYENVEKHLLDSKMSALHVIYWFSFGFDGKNWKLIRERHVAGFKSLEYCSLDKCGEGIVLLSHDNYFFLYDSVEPLLNSSGGCQNLEDKAPKYIFMQNDEELKLWINLGQDVMKKDIHIDARVQDLKIRVKEDNVLDKKFLNTVDSYATTWKIESGKLEICLLKSCENVRWSSLFEGGDKDGEELLDPTLVEEVHKRLAHLTSSEWNANPDPERPAFNPGQLEECDDASEDLILSILDGSSHQVSHSSHLGAVQHLLNVHLEGNVVPSFCLRHDVDGLLWELEDDRSFDHIATFHAFGYVKASKSMAKFTKGSPDYSYVAVSDVNSHVYVFCQPEAFGGELRNRKSGKISTTIARQLIISLKTHDQVMGFHAAPKCVFVLTDSELFVYTLQVS